MGDMASIKPRMTLIPQRALQDIARNLTWGEKKHGATAYLEPSSDPLVSQCDKQIDAALRHINESRMGVEADHETGLDPLVHAAARLMLAIEIKHQEQEAHNGREKETTLPVPEQNGQHENGMCPICGDCDAFDYEWMREPFRVADERDHGGRLPVPNGVPQYRRRRRL